MLNFFKKKRPTDLPKLKLMGRSMANKYILKECLGMCGDVGGLAFGIDV